MSIPQCTQSGLDTLANRQLSSKGVFVYIVFSICGFDPAGAFIAVKASVFIVDVIVDHLPHSFRVMCVFVRACWA